MPTLIDLFCGRGGWTQAALKAGWDAVGYDVHDHGYPGELVLRSLPIDPAILNAHNPSLIVASPPCEDFARACLPWLRTVTNPSTDLLRWSIDLRRHVHCPVIVECSHFASRFVDGARFCGSYALWGDLPALLPHTPRRKMKHSGTDPARRAMIEPALADWIISCSSS